MKWKTEIIMEITLKYYKKIIVYFQIFLYPYHIHASLTRSMPFFSPLDEPIFKKFNQL